MWTRKWLVGILFFSFISIHGFSQTTSWIGGTSSIWRTASNWTNGVPDASKDVIIGDGSFTGPNEPTLSLWFGSGQCKSLTLIGAHTLTLFDDLTVYGSITIGSTSRIDHELGNITLEGNWLNSGTYNPTSGNRKVYFSGAGQSIGGSVVTTFEQIHINSGSTVTLARNVTVANFMELSGTLDPTQSFSVTAGSGDINIRAGGVLKVMASTFTGNYSAGSADATNSSSVIDYAASAISQTVSNSVAYEVLRISGGMTKTLAGNTTIGQSVIIDGGTLDLSTFTANRSTPGGNGSFTMAAGTTLRIGGTNTFPSNYSSTILANTSTVVYYGGNQAVSAKSYGHLTLTSSGGAVTKTMPGTAFSIAGNFSSSASAGTLSYTAGNNISVAGNISIGANTTFGASTFSHTLGGNWTNNGTFNGCATPASPSTVTSNGAGSVWSGSGANNFGNLVIIGNNTVLDQNTSITLCGNFSTTGSGSFTHTTGGTGVFTMTGTSKTISGSGIVLDDLTIASGSVSTSSSFVLVGNLITTGTLTASGGTISMVGSGKTISGAGALQFSTLNVPGTISTAKNFSISSNFSVGASGSFTASAGQVSFNGTSTFSGTANLFNVSLGGGNTLTMGTSAVLGIAGTVTSSGTFNPSTNVPNTVNYNGTGAQATVFTTFNNLTLSNGNTKTPSAGLTVGGDLTIGAGTTFTGGTFTHAVSGNWVNNGTFTSGTSTVQFTGSNDSHLTGATTFNNLTINKGSAANVLTLANNISAANVAMTQGKMLTGANSVTITSTRTGNGIIIGTITRTHAFSTGTNYAFEGPNNFINFSSITSGTISSITVTVAVGPVTSFPAASSANRSYNISVSASGGTTYVSSVRLHYEQAEINGNAESAMTFWNDGGIGSWTDQSKNSNNVLEDWVEKTGVTNLLNTWTLSEGLIKFSWTGATSTAWGTSTNWSPNGIPSITDVVHLGDQVFTNQPVISPAAQVKKMYFDSTTPVTLTLSGGGSITVQGNIDGVWSADAIHNINLGTGSLTTFSDIVMSDGTANRRINISASTGIINVNGSLTQTGGANLTFTGAGSLNIGENYNYVSGTFTPGTSTVTYNGIADQSVADVTYYNLAFDKTSGIALIAGNTTATNNVSTATSGAVNVAANLDVDGNVNIGAGTVMSVVGTPTINVGGNWIEDGLFVPGFGTVTFDGTGAQSLEPTLLNNMIVNKASGTLTLGGNLGINGNVTVQSGTVDAVGFTVTRSVLGGSASMGPGTTIRFGGSVLQIFEFASVSIDPASTIEYYGTNITSIPPVTYGNLIVSNGGSNAKNIIGPTTVAGDLTINSGATLATPATTLTLQGNLINNGTFDTALGSLVLEGTNKTITGGFVANDLIISGSYDVLSGNIEVNDRVEVTATGDFDAGSSTVTLRGDVINNGNYSTDGITIFTGNQIQVIQLNNAINSSATGVVNFNGTVEPEFNSTAAPVLATVNINNTAAIVPSQPWTVLVAMNISSGSTFNGGPLNHRFSGNFNNAGIYNSSGTTTFNPSGSVNVVLGNNFNSTGVVDFGGTGTLNLTDNTPTFHSVNITNTNAAGVTAGSDWIVTQDLFIGPGAEFHGGSGTTHTISGGWTNNGVFSGGTSAVVFNSSTGFDEIGGIGINNFNNITFASGAQFGIVTDIAVAGNLTNDATSLSLVNGEVTFNGSGLSVIGGASVCSFGDLVIDKSAATVRMDNDANVASTLTLTNGVLALNANTLAVTNATDVAVFRTNGYVLSEDVNMNSRFNWTVNNNLASYEFPFGSNAGDYIPFVFELSTGDAGTVSVATYATGANNLPLPPGVNHVKDQFGVDNSINTVDRFFQIDILGGTTPTANITFNMTAAEVGSITTLLGQRWNGTFWDAPMLGQTSGATSVTVPNVTQFSPWAVSGNSTPLPITLVDFSARQVVNQIILDWSTASEIDNDYFEIEKSYDAKKFVSIGTQKGAGDSDQLTHYRFTDRELKEGTVYYRLKQVDFDGKSTMSNIVSLNVNPAGKIELQVFPNPTTDFLNISNQNGLSDNVFVTMLDGSGKVVMKGEGNGASEPLTIDMRNLNPGTYMVQVITGSTSRIFRVVKAE